MKVRFFASMLFFAGMSGLNGADPPNVKFGIKSGDRDAGLWAKVDDAPASDGEIRLRALWVRSSPAREILSENGDFRLSEKQGWTYEFYVLLENVGSREIEVPSIIDREPRSTGIPLNGAVLVPYLVRFNDLNNEITFVESASAFRPVTLRPGEAMRLPIYYQIAEKLEPHWFFYAVDETVAKRYGWWSGALKCKAEEFLPKQPAPATRTGDSRGKLIER